LPKSLSTIAEARLNELVAFARALDDSTQKLVLQSIRMKLTDPVVKAQLKQVEKLAQGTDAQIRAWLTQHVPESYFDGYLVASKKVKAKALTYQAFLTNDKTLFHREAINMLLKESYSDFARTMTQAVKGAERILTDTARQQIRGKLIAGDIMGESMYKISRDVRQSLADDGFRVMIDRAGRKWQLPDYSEMLARTNLIKTANEGVVNRLSELGYDLVEWMTGDNACDTCDPLDGKVFSTSGNNDQYPALEEQPPKHPNCRCSLAPRPELE
jgi:SPP1 gp7 family putative phage head morphogenesis protein